jgi:predicted nuclease of restriction endonuclease-like (RecB) superfamily
MAKKKSEPGKTPARRPAKDAPSILKGYEELLVEIKERVRAAQVRAAVAVNRELIELYWHIGRSIVERQGAQGWGKSVVERLARDLRAEFPGVGGFSPRNVWRMRAFYLAYTEEVKKLPRGVAEMDGENLPRPVAEIPWGHNSDLMDKVKDPRERLWYAKAAVEHGWSRAVLAHWIDSDLHRRQGKASTNFERALPSPQSDLARELLKDPYNFDFLTISQDAEEREIERGLVDHIRQFLLELGVGFAFVGRQYRLEVGGEDFFIDLLFYHLKLRCYVVLELKAGTFKPEYAGKMNFYLSAVDDLLRHPDDEPSIGIILCRSKNEVIAEYALRDVRKPVGVSSYVTKLVESLPAKLKGSLPSPEALEAELRKGGDEEAPGKA